MKNLQRITLFPYYAIRRIYHCYLQRYNPRKYAKILHSAVAAENSTWNIRKI